MVECWCICLNFFCLVAWKTIQRLVSQLVNTVKCIRTTHKHTNIHALTMHIYNVWMLHLQHSSTFCNFRNTQQAGTINNAEKLPFMLVLGRRRLFAQTHFEHTKCEDNFMRIFKHQCCHSIDTDSVAKLKFLSWQCSPKFRVSPLAFQQQHVMAFATAVVLEHDRTKTVKMAH